MRNQEVPIDREQMFTYLNVKFSFYHVTKENVTFTPVGFKKTEHRKKQTADLSELKNEDKSRWRSSTDEYWLLKV